MSNDFYVIGVKTTDKITIRKALLDNEMSMSAYVRPIIEKLANFEREHGGLPNKITLSLGEKTSEIRYDLKPHY